ncbi:hypothetical protein ACO0K0_02430 [Undibacterium sp. SXout11W]|uniref:hypothetical protein n=1 Tax=Undibacterium sp. SXout11W TaxID=3413050 RepID=UPI003BF1B6BB
MPIFIITDGEFIMDDRSKKSVGDHIELANDIAAQYGSRLRRVIEDAEGAVVQVEQHAGGSEIVDSVQS